MLFNGTHFPFDLFDILSLLMTPRTSCYQAFRVNSVVVDITRHRTRPLHVSHCSRCQKLRKRVQLILSHAPFPLYIFHYQKSNFKLHKNITMKIQKIIKKEQNKTNNNYKHNNIWIFIMNIN